MLGISQIVSSQLMFIGLRAKEPEDALKKRGGILASLWSPQHLMKSGIVLSY